MATSGNANVQNSQEFAAPGSHRRKLRCQGRRCAKCGKCRDRYFIGDAATLDWLWSVTDWNIQGNKIAINRWAAEGLDSKWKHRDGGTCRGPHGYYYYPVDFTLDSTNFYGNMCFCPDNVHN